MNEHLNDLRNRIDSIDNQMLELLNKRMEVIKEVGKLKRINNAIIYRPEREKSILDRLNYLNQGLLTAPAIEAIFLEIFAVSRNYELPERIAYLGPEGSFSHQAAESRFGSLSDYIALSNIKSVFESVATQRARFGIVPIENNQEGSVKETIDMLRASDVKIVAEIPLNIHFTFASMEDRLRRIKKIYSKDIAFRQCQKFISEYFNDDVQLIPVESTSQAAKLASEEAGSAAICSEIAAKLYQLPLLFENIEDSSHNRTRFLIISKSFETQYSSGCKTSLIAQIPDDTEAGSLAKLLEDFGKAKINLTKIESHPAKEGERFAYWFLIDFDGHSQDEKVSAILEKNKEFVKLLGSYVKLV
ncbi:MAG: prephenate dehydratase [Cytophagales bacterium]|nr:MAG: prephenate dehydratase [Cytophagales bacterium]